MTTPRLKDPSGQLTSIIDDDAALADGARAAGDYDNSTSGFLWAVAKLTVQYDGGPPTAGALAAELYNIPGDAESTEEFADGGDAGLGTDDDPQGIHFVEGFTTVNPSTSVDEILMTRPMKLHPHGNRFVLKNVSGQQMDATWQLDLLPYQPDLP